MGSVNIPTFFGMFTARSAIAAAQAQMNTINHNIANANTEGYSRQRVDLHQVGPFPPATISNYVGSGQIGAGVAVSDVVRTYDNFIDEQIRRQNSLQQYQQPISNNLSYIESILGEPNGNGLNEAMSNFFNSAQALSIHPDDLSARTSFMLSAKTLLDTAQEQAQLLSALRTNIVGDASSPVSISSSQVAITVTQINNDLTQIANLNSQIMTASVVGATPNDLLDQRDKLLNDLSKKLNITVTHQANNMVNVSLGSNDLIRGAVLRDTLQVVANPGPTPDPNDTPSLVQLASTSTTVNSDIRGGSLGGLLSIGDNSSSSTSIRSVLENMDTLFNEIATQVNSLQAAGRDLSGNIPTAGNDAIFNLAAGTGLSIFRYSINENLLADSTLVAAAIDDSGAFAGRGDGRNALAIAQLASTSLAGLGNFTPGGFFNNTVARLGNDSQAAQRASERLDEVVKQLEQRRSSIRGVNLEEEMVDLMRFQRGFEASARVLSTLDKIIDLIINGLF